MGLTENFFEKKFSAPFKKLYQVISLIKFFGGQRQAPAVRDEACRQSSESGSLPTKQRLERQTTMMN
jgi:hypothetical protein